MARIDLGHSEKYRDTVVTMMCLYQSATIILRELARERGNGPWFEALREEIRATIKELSRGSQSRGTKHLPSLRE